MTAACDGETICVSHVLSLSIRLFDIIAISHWLIIIYMVITINDSSSGEGGV